MKYIEKGVLIGALIVSISVTTNSQSDISNKLDTIISVSKKGKIDSLEYELMSLGSRLDSMILKHDYNFVATN